MSDHHSEIPLTMYLVPLDPAGRVGTHTRDNMYETDYYTGTSRALIRGRVDARGEVFTVTEIDGKRPDHKIVVPVYTIAGGSFELVTNEFAQAAIGPLAPTIPVPKWRTADIPRVRFAGPEGIAGGRDEPTAEVTDIVPYLPLTETREKLSTKDQLAGFVVAPQTATNWVRLDIREESDNSSRLINVRLKGGLRSGREFRPTRMEFISVDGSRKEVDLNDIEVDKLSGPVKDRGGQLTYAANDDYSAPIAIAHTAKAILNNPVRFVGDKGASIRKKLADGGNSRFPERLTDVALIDSNPRLPEGPPATLGLGSRPRTRT